MPTITVAETFRSTVSPYLVTLAFAPPQGISPEMKPELSLIALPLVVAKQLCLVLRKQLRTFEERQGTITIPPETYPTMGVAPEDWENWLKKE